MKELWQQYNEQAEPVGEGITPDEAFSKGILHGAAHVWIWRLV